jgi:hypothetical protein
MPIEFASKPLLAAAFRTCRLQCQSRGRQSPLRREDSLFSMSWINRSVEPWSSSTDSGKGSGVERGFDVHKVKTLSSRGTITTVANHGECKTIHWSDVVQAG